MTRDKLSIEFVVLVKIGFMGRSGLPQSQEWVEAVERKIL